MILSGSKMNCKPTRVWANANVMVALPNVGGALCSMLLSLADATTRCRACTLPRRETGQNLQGCLKLPDQSQLLVGRSSPYCGDMWRTYCCLTVFFPIVDTWLSCEDISRQSCAMVHRWRFLATFLHPVFSACHVQQLSDLHLNTGHKK